MRVIHRFRHRWKGSIFQSRRLPLTNSYDSVSGGCSEMGCQMGKLAREILMNEEKIHLPNLDPLIQVLDKRVDEEFYDSSFAHFDLTGGSHARGK